MKPGGQSLPFAVLGHPIGHTLSPVMHNAAFRALDLNAVYLAFDVAPARLMPVLQAMADMGFKGVNLTVPLKQVGFKGLSDLDPSARMMGAVNTVEFRTNGPVGHNTDGVGFLRAVEEAFGTSVGGVSALVLGCGGAGRAVALACAAEGAARIVLTDADAARPEKLLKTLHRQNPSVAASAIPADPAAWRKAAAEADLVVQATPMGMKPDDASLLPPEAFRRGQMAFDLVYMYPQTAFTRAASEGGARAANGLGMLLHQGARALSIWIGKPAPLDVMRRALEEEVYGGKSGGSG